MDISAIFEIEKINGKLWIKLEDFIEYDKRKDKEIERLEEEYVMLQNASDEVEDELQAKIDKAIEYITNKSVLSIKGLDLNLCDNEVEYLLEILKGSDKE